MFWTVQVGLKGWEVISQVEVLLVIDVAFQMELPKELLPSEGHTMIVHHGGESIRDGIRGSSMNRVFVISSRRKSIMSMHARIGNDNLVLLWQRV